MDVEYVKYRLGELGTIVSGATPSTKHPEYYDGDIPWITPKDLSIQRSKYISKGEKNLTPEGYDSCSATLIPPGSIVMSSRAPIGYLAITKNELCTNQGFKSIIPSSSLVDSEYLYYKLLSMIDEIKELGTGTTFPEISGKVFSSICVDLPPLEYQNDVARKLKLLDDLIACNERINDYLVS